jgi:hypothetical protein
VGDVARPLIVALVLLLATTASAQSRVEIRACTTLDDPPLRRALDAELAGIEDTAPLDVTITCEGEDTITLATRDGRLRRTLDVSDVAPRLHARLVALALAEQALGATEATDAARAPDARSGEAPNADAVSATAATERPAAPDAAAAAPAGTDTTATTPAASVARPEVLVSQGESVDASGAPRAAALDAPDTRPRRAGRHTLARVALDGRAVETSRLAPLARGVVRLFPAQGTGSFGGELLVRLGPIAFGTHASGATKEDVLGRATATLVLGLAELSLACVDRAWLELCGGVRAALGRAAVTATANTASDARALAGPFVEGAFGVSGAAILGPVAFALDAWLGYAGGVVARADTRTLFALDGLSLTLGLSVEVLP